MLIWYIYRYQGRSQGGCHRCMCTPLFKKSNKQKTNNLLCRIIRFYTNNPKCQYVYLSFYLNDYQIIVATGACAPPPPLGLKRPPDPSPNNFAPPFLIPGYGPETISLAWFMICGPDFLWYIGVWILHSGSWWWKIEPCPTRDIQIQNILRTNDTRYT